MSGSVHFRWRVAPGTCLGLASPWVEQTVHGKVIRVDGRTLAVRGIDHGPRGGGDRALAGSFTTSAGSRHLVTMSSSGDEPIHVPEPAKTDEGVDRTIQILSEQVERTMRLLGVNSLEELEPRHVTQLERLVPRLRQQ